MSRFRKLSQTIWHCQYHLVWVPKYRFRILTGEIGEEVSRCIKGFSERAEVEVVELSIQADLCICWRWFRRSCQSPIMSGL